MNSLLPDPRTAKVMGWTHQVEWLERGERYVIRFTSGADAEAFKEKLRQQNLSSFVIDLIQALSLD